MNLIKSPIIRYYYESLVKSVDQGRRLSNYRQRRRKESELMGSISAIILEAVKERVPESDNFYTNIKDKKIVVFCGGEHSRLKGICKKENQEIRINVS